MAIVVSTLSIFLYSSRFLHLLRIFHAPTALWLVWYPLKQSSKRLRSPFSRTSPSHGEVEILLPMSEQRGLLNPGLEMLFLSNGFENSKSFYLTLPPSGSHKPRATQERGGYLLSWQITKKTTSSSWSIICTPAILYEKKAFCERSEATLHLLPLALPSVLDFRQPFRHRCPR